MQINKIIKITLIVIVSVAKVRGMVKSFLTFNKNETNIEKIRHAYINLNPCPAEPGYTLPVQTV